MPAHLMITGWSGASWRRLHDLGEDGLLPTAWDLVDRGALGTLAATRPEALVPLWTTLATGRRAHAHGLLDDSLIETRDGAEQIAPASARQRLRTTLWERIAAAGGRALVVGWPGTQDSGLQLDPTGDPTADPASDLAIVSDLFGQSRLARTDGLLAGALHPPTLAGRLAECWVQPEEIDAESIAFFVPDWQQVQQQRDPRLGLIAEALALTLSRQAAFTALLADGDWDLAAVCWPLVERLAPVFDGAPAPFDRVMERAYRLLDTLLANALEQAAPRQSWLISPDARLGPGPGPSQAGQGAGSAQLEVLSRSGTGFLVAAGEGISADHLVHGASVLDLFPTWLAAAGQAVPAPLPGRILAELFTEPPTPERVENRPPEDAAPIAPGAPIWTADALMGHLLAGPLATEDRPPRTDPRHLARQRQRLDWHRAQSLLDAGLAQQALPIIEDLQRAFPEHPLAALQLAETRIQLGDLVGARQAAAALLDQAPGALPARLLMARLEREAGHHEAALAQLTQAEAEGADSAQLHSQIAYTQLYLRRWAEAAASYTRALALSPDDLGAHLGRARALLALRRFAEAREHALAAVGVDFHRPLGHFYLGLALVRQGELEAGLKALQVAAAQAPDAAGAHAWILRVMKRLQRPAEERQPHLEALHRLRFQRKARRARVRDLPPPTAESLPAPADEPPFDWSALDAIPDTPPQPRDLVLVTALPGGGGAALMHRLRRLGWRLTDDPEQAIRRLDGDPSPLAQGEGRVLLMAPVLLGALPRLHHYQVLLVRQPPERVAEALSGRAGELGLGRDALIRLVDRYQRGLHQFLAAAPHVDLVDLDDQDLGLDDDALQASLSTQLGQHRVAAFAG